MNDINHLGNTKVVSEIANMGYATSRGETDAFNFEIGKQMPSGILPKIGYYSGAVIGTASIAINFVDTTIRLGSIQLEIKGADLLRRSGFFNGNGNKVLEVAIETTSRQNPSASVGWVERAKPNIKLREKPFNVMLYSRF